MRFFYLLPMLAAATGCTGGAASLVLKSPVQSKCEELKLKGCDRLSEGVVLYVDGNKAKGYSELQAGIAANTDEPLKLKALATGLKLLQKAPGVGPYVATLRPVIELVDDAASQALLEQKADREDGKDDRAKTAKGTTKGGAPQPEEPRPVALSPRGLAVEATRTGTVALSQSKRADRCTVLAEVPGLLPSGAGVCALAIEGPFALSDVYSEGGCPHDLVIFAGEPERPIWILHAPAGKAFALHGAYLGVSKGVQLYVGALVPQGQQPAASLACAVTWSGQRL
jgi:hypothetical protein